MQLLCLCLAIVAVLVIVIPAPALGLTCWSCTSDRNSKCGEDNFSGDESITMLKKDCSAIFRNEPTSCTKYVIKNRDVVTVTRECIAKRNSAIQDGTCKTTNNGLGSATECLCSGELCNNAVTRSLFPFLLFITFGLLGKALLDNTRNM